VAIIDVFPGSPTAIQDILAKHKHRAVLDGKRSLQEAFVLDSLAGVEIDGFILFAGTSLGFRIHSRLLDPQRSARTGQKLIVAHQKQPHQNRRILMGLFWLG